MRQLDLQRLPGGLVPQVQGCDDGVGDQRRISNLCEVDPPGAAREATLQVRRDPYGQAGLADASRADEADQTSNGQRLPSLGQLPAATHEARRLGGNVAGPAPGPCHNEPHGTSQVIWR